jgi:hypothetical protein
MLNAIAFTRAFWRPRSRRGNRSLVGVRQCQAGVWSSCSADTTLDADIAIEAS